VEASELSNSHGMTATVITWGGIVTSLKVPDREGRLGDVVLGFDTLAPYLAPNPFFGAITGRIAGRVPGGKLTIDGESFQLPLNSGPHHIHGGHTGLDKRLWEAEVRGDTLRLTYHSPDGEEGYPGNLDIAVSYTLTDTNELVIETEATSDRTTPLSLTNHSYFNLAGEGTIDDHEIEVFADYAFERDDTLATTGRVLRLDGTAADLRRPTRLGTAIPTFFHRHGDLYQIRRDSAGTLVPVARVTHAASGRVLEVRSTQTCMQLYTSSHFEQPIPGKGGVVYPRFGGVCLECEGYPDAVNTPGFGDIMVRPGTPQRHLTVFAFTVL
jgi:aldose 1-epimerase